MATTKATTKTTTTTRTRAAAAKSKPAESAETKAASTPTPEGIDLNRVSKPLYASVGAADLAVEKLRTLPDAYASGVNSAVNSAQAQVSSARGSVKSSVKTLPVAVRGQLTALPSKAKVTYSELVERGHKLVTTVQQSPSTQAALKQAKTARAQAKGATTSALKSVKSVEKVAGAVKLG